MTEKELIERKKVLWHIYDRLENEIAFYSVQRDKEERTMWKEMYTKQIEAIRSEADTIKYALDLVEEKLDGVRWQNERTRINR